MSVPKTGPTQCSFNSEVTSVLLLKSSLPQKDVRVFVFVIKIINTYPIRYRVKPSIKGQILDHSLVDNLPMRIVLALPNFASLKVANISVQI